MSAQLGQINPSTNHLVQAVACQETEFASQRLHGPCQKKDCSICGPHQSTVSEGPAIEKEAPSGHLPGRVHSHLIPAAPAHNKTLCSFPLIFPSFDPNHGGKRSDRQRARGETEKNRKESEVLLYAGCQTEIKPDGAEIKNNRLKWIS